MVPIILLVSIKRPAGIIWPIRIVLLVPVEISVRIVRILGPIRIVLRRPIRIIWSIRIVSIGLVTIPIVIIPTISVLVSVTIVLTIIVCPVSIVSVSVIFRLVCGWGAVLAAYFNGHCDQNNSKTEEFKGGPKTKHKTLNMILRNSCLSLFKFSYLINLIL